MLFRRWSLLFLAIAALSIPVLTAVRQANAGSFDFGVVGHVYVNNNTSGVNSISAFNRHFDGSLTPTPGSPFNIGGAGTGAIIGSQGSLQLSSNQNYLLAVDAGSNQISVVRIHPDGSLSAVGNPVSSGGITPISIAVNKALLTDLVYVANTGVGGSNYTGFRLTGGGQLIPIPNSTFALPDTASPGDILFNGNGRHLVATRVGPDVGPSFIDSFIVGLDGRLTPAAGSPFPAQGVGPFGSEFRPTNPQQLYVSNAHNGAGAGTISAYNVGFNGVLSSIGSSPYPDNQTAPCWVEISHDGRYLFTVNTGDSTISSYSISGGGSLTLLGSTPFKQPTGLRPFDARLDDSGRYLYVVDAGLKAVSVFRVNNGSLTEIASSPVSLPANVTPFGMVVT